MPTKHPRIAIVRDETIDRAIKRARAVLGTRADAALARELIVRGADGLSPARDPDGFDARLDELGASPAVGSLAATLARLGPLGPVDPNDPTPGSDALARLRED